MFSNYQIDVQRGSKLSSLAAEASANVHVNLTNLLSILNSQLSIK